jgi:hypothetical protein
MDPDPGGPTLQNTTCCVFLSSIITAPSLCGQDAGAVDRKPAVSPEKKAEVSSGAAPPAAAPPPAADAKSRVLVGVMRVGLLAKQLLLR